MSLTDSRGQLELEAQRLIEATGHLPHPDDPVPKLILDLPVFRPVVLQLMKLLSHEDTSIEEIAHAVQGDPSIATEILHVANSPLFSFVSRISSIRHAIVVLGFEHVRKIVFAILLRASLMKRYRGQALQRCWAHSVATATIAEFYAQAFHTARDRAYTAGLIHDVGRLALLASKGKEYEHLLERPYRELSEVLVAERSYFGLHHAEAGMWLCRTWGFPEELASSVFHHHLEPERVNLSGVVQFACRLASAMGYRSLDLDVQIDGQQLVEAVSKSLGLRLQAELEALHDHVKRSLDVFGVVQ